MTWKQYKELFNSLPPRYKWKELTKEEQKKHDELSCISMINSCLIYRNSNFDFINSEYAKSYIEDLWIRRVKKLYEEQKKDFKKSEIVYAWEDSEWWTYYWIKRYDD